MELFFTPWISFWAFTLMGSGWLYSALAHFGPHLFHHGLIEHGAFPTALGYQFGRTIFWRLSRRAAGVIALLSLAPLLALTLPTPIAAVGLSFGSLLILAAWLTHTPRRQVSLMDLPPGTEGQSFFELQANPGFLRAIVVFLMCGLIPSALIGSGVNWLVYRWIMK